MSTITEEDNHTKTPNNKGESPDIPDFNIPLVFKKKRIGVIEKIGFNPDTEFPSIIFSGKLFHILEKPDVLVKLLQIEGIHLGE